MEVEFDPEENQVLLQMSNLELRGSAKLRSIETGGYAELILIQEPFAMAEVVIGFEK